MKQNTKRAMPMMIASSLLVGACVAPDAISPDNIVRNAPKNVAVRVKHLASAGECAAAMKTNGPKDTDGQNCNGIGSTNGVACGRMSDVIEWQGLNIKTITEVSFESMDESENVTNEMVCADVTTLKADPPTCTLLEPALGGENDPPIAYKYTIKYVTNQGETCEIDPYIIVTRG
jgi:hypothetical protein